MVKKLKAEKAPPIDKLIKPAIGVVIAFLGYYFIKGIQSEIPRIDVNDELALRQVFFGEGFKTHVVLCHTPHDNDDKKASPISSVFSDAAASSLWGRKRNVEFVLLDCHHTLPNSGKTIAQRFQINVNKRPTIFVVINEEVKQIPSSHCKTGSMLVKALTYLLEPHSIKLTNAKQFKDQCLSRDYCALLLKGGPVIEPYVKTAMKNLMEAYPNIQFANIDSTVFFLTNLEQYIPEYVPGQHRFVLFHKLSGGDNNNNNTTNNESSNNNNNNETKQHQRLITSFVTLKEEDSFSVRTASNLIDAHYSTTTDGKKKKTLRKIPMIPQMKTRTKKLEEAERKKRERNKNLSTERPTSSTSMNEDRKMERDRKRQEHLKATNPNYTPKTPEEIMEMEKRRRERMEEEARNWNIQSEDDTTTTSSKEEKDENDNEIDNLDDVTKDGDDGTPFISMMEDDVLDLD